MITITYSTLELIALGLVILNTVMVMLWFRNRSYTNGLHELMEVLTEELIGDDDQGV
jgi:hypothetical protein